MGSGKWEELLSRAGHVSGWHRQTRWRWSKLRSTMTKSFPQWGECFVIETHSRADGQVAVPAAPAGWEWWRTCDKYTGKWVEKVWSRKWKVERGNRNGGWRHEQLDHLVHYGILLFLIQVHSLSKSDKKSINPFDRSDFPGKSPAIIPFWPLMSIRCWRPPKRISVTHTGSRLRRKDSTVSLAEEAEISCVNASKCGRSRL